MEKSREKVLWRLLARRLRSARGTAYIEFAAMAPIFLIAVLFAADFTRVLYVEQQVDIATRALCDVECHLRPGARKCPGLPAKRVVRTYLAEALAKEGLVARDAGGKVLTNGGTRADRMRSVYCKGSVDKQTGPVHDLINTVSDFMNGKSKSKFFDFVGRFLGTAVDFVTMKTGRYVTEVFPTDKVVKTSVSVLVRPVVPGHAFTLFGRRRGGNSNSMLIVNAAPNGKGQRVRYYCHMPSMDTATVAPFTDIRQRIAPIFGKWLK